VLTPPEYACSQRMVRLHVCACDLFLCHCGESFRSLSASPTLPPFPHPLTHSLTHLHLYQAADDRSRRAGDIAVRHGHSLSLSSLFLISPTLTFTPALTRLLMIARVAPGTSRCVMVTGRLTLSRSAHSCARARASVKKAAVKVSVSELCGKACITMSPRWMACEEGREGSGERG
jgi:hypothetical protein